MKDHYIYLAMYSYITYTVLVLVGQNGQQLNGLYAGWAPSSHIGQSH